MMLKGVARIFEERGTYKEIKIDFACSLQKLL